MEVKNWTYEDFPEFTTEVEGAVFLPTTGDEVSVTYLNDVEYAKVDDISLHLQILIPKTRNHPQGVYPCIVYVKGSAWMKQNLYGSLPQISKLAERGFVVAVVEYRHSGLASFPSQIIDARNAIRFLRKNAAAYQINPDQMFVAGDSSGGHTAMFAGMIHDDVENNLYPSISADVKGIINYYGSCSVMADDSNPTTENHCLADSPEGMVMGHIDLDEDLKKKLSVECNITEETIIPPTLIIHGTKDRTVNCQGSVILYQQMKKCGKDVTLYLLKGADHGGAEFWSEPVLDIVEAFVRKCL